MPNLAILVSAVLVLSCGQTDRMTDADERYKGKGKGMPFV